MPNPDPSLTPEEAAEAYAREYIPICQASAKTHFIAGHAHATAELRAQVARLTKERDSALAYCGSQPSRSDFKTADDMRAEIDRLRAELEGERLKVTSGINLAENIEKENDRLRAKLESAQHDSSSVRFERENARKECARQKSEKLEALAVVEKMRAALEELQRCFNCGCTSGAFIYECNACRLKRDFINPALSTPPAVALLEFAEKVYREAWMKWASSKRVIETSFLEDWAKSETYRSLTRATGEAPAK